MEKICFKIKHKHTCQKVWEMIRKINGKQGRKSVGHLVDNDGNKVTERVDIANTLAKEISKNSSSNNYSAKFQKYQQKAEKEN